MEDQPDEANECQVNTQPDKREGSFRAFPIFYSILLFPLYIFIVKLYFLQGKLLISTKYFICNRTIYFHTC
jgi:hypothetical protein